MKKIIPLLVLTSAILCGCETAKDIRTDAENTPIGTVLTGKTNSAEEYIKRVSDENRANDRETWRPLTAENM